jgi:hypothetical protein
MLESCHDPLPDSLYQKPTNSNFATGSSAFGTPQQVALRSQIGLAAAEGQSDNAIAQQLEVNRKTVMLWRTRFTQEGLDVCGRWHRGGVANRPMARRRSRPSWMPRYVANPKE